MLSRVGSSEDTVSRQGPSRLLRSDCQGAAPRLTRECGVPGVQPPARLPAGDPLALGGGPGHHGCDDGPHQVGTVIVGACCIASQASTASDCTLCTLPLSFVNMHLGLGVAA